MRKSSVHFKQVSNASVSIAHVTRTEKTEPAYLLPKEHRLDNVIVPGSMSNIDLGLEFTRAKASMTGQAKARGSSPFWEGVVVLDGTDFKAQTAALQSWKKEYEKTTGQRVLHMAIHGDEGFINSAGKPEYNIHAHVIVNRLNGQGRVIKLERKHLSAVQDLTAKSLGMQRGETLEERKGMRGRKHLNHREFKAQANEKRLDAEHNIGAIQKSKADTGKAEAEVVDLKAKLDGEPARLDAALKAQEAQLNEQYRSDREALKASGEAKQADYQTLKIAHETALKYLENSKRNMTAMDEYSKKLKAALVKSDEKIATELIAKAEAIEASVQAGIKSESLLVTAEGHRSAAEKLTEKLAVSEEKLGKLEVRHEAFKVKANEKIAGIITEANEKLGALRVDLAAANKLVEGFKQAKERIKTPPEQPKTQNPYTPTTKPEKSLGEALKDSMKEFFQGWVDFIKSKGFTHAELDASKGQYRGTILDADDLFAVQKTDRDTCVIHLLSDLDTTPDLDNPDIFIRYRDGVGQVSGQKPEPGQYPRPGVGR